MVNSKGGLFDLHDMQDCNVPVDIFVIPYKLYSIHYSNSYIMQTSSGLCSKPVLWYMLTGSKLQSSIRADAGQHIAIWQ